MKNNKKALYKYFFVAISLLLIINFTASAQTSYIAKHRQLTDSLSEAYGIPSSVILGIATIESGAGQDRNPKLLNNHFGVVGKNNLMQTKGIKTMYKGYASAKASFIDFCNIISRKSFYTHLKGNTDYKVWLNAISKAGYSTQPETWKRLITDAIVKLNLN
jgi:flagellum-specific peptidoglycan hydrolase FlgJ